MFRTRGLSGADPFLRRATTASAPSVRELRLNRAVGAYLGLAVGDALGATVEFMTPNEIRHQYGVHREMIGGGWLKLRPGSVTDDTTMALALGESILRAGGRVDALAAAQAFDEWMRGKPVDIGNTVRRNLIGFRRTGNPEAPASEHDAGNGAAMRLAPVALAYLGEPEDDTLAAVRAQAHVTHHNGLSDAGCEALVMMTQDFILGENDITVLHLRAHALVARFPEYMFRGKPRLNPSGYVVDTLVAVFQALFETESFEDCLVNVVNRGGDADTTGAIAGMLAGARYGATAIPRRWLDALDPIMRDKCRTQARALLANFLD